MAQGLKVEEERRDDRSVQMARKSVPDCRPYHWSYLVVDLLAALAQRLARHLVWLHRTFESQMQ